MAWRGGAGDHPLVTWYAALKRADSASVRGSDVVLGDAGGKRFALGVAEGPCPLLAYLAEDADVIGSVRWTSAAIIRAHEGRDWLALSAKDVRVKGSGEMNPVPMRLWIPVATGRLDAWAEAGATRLRLQQMDASGKAPAVSGAPLAELALKVVS